MSKNKETNNYNKKIEQVEEQISIKKITNKKLVPKKIQENFLKVITGTIYLLIVSIYELLFCNSNFILNNGSYNFSPFRIVVYIVCIILYIIFNKKIVEQAIEAFSSKFKRYAAMVYYILALGIYIFLFIRIDAIALPKLALYMIAILMGTIFITYVQKDYIKNMILVSSTFGVVFAISTDMNHPYDEIRHFISAFNVSVGNFNFEEFKMDEQLKEIPLDSNYMQINQFFAKNYDTRLEEQTDNESFLYTPAPYSFIIYLFSSFGIFLANILGGSLADIYITGRIFNLVFYTILAVITLKILPYKKQIFSAILMIPMIICLAASYSIDGVCVGLVSIFIAYCLKVYDSKKVLTLKDVIKLGICFALLLLAKSMAYICVALIFLILPLKETIKKNKKYIPIMLIIAVIACVCMVFGISYVKETKVVDDPRGGSDVSEQIEYCLSNPLKIIQILGWHTVKTLFAPNWLAVTNSVALFGEYSTLMFIFLITLLIYVAILDDSKKFKVKEKIIFAISFLAVFGMTSIVLYLNFTKVGSGTINGYQARYLFPILSLIFMGMNLKCVSVKKSKDMTIILTILSNIIVFMDLLLLIRK